jgi:hypothetical protein
VSCAYVFIALGRYERAREYLQLQSGAEYEKAGELEILVREGKQDEALQSLTFLPTAGFFGRQLMEPCLRHRPPSKGAVAAAQKLRSELMEKDDPFPKYLLGRLGYFLRSTGACRSRAAPGHRTKLPRLSADGDRSALARVRGKPEYS